MMSNETKTALEQVIFICEASAKTWRSLVGKPGMVPDGEKIARAQEDDGIVNHVRQMIVRAE
jgi:hypothetical protein